MHNDFMRDKAKCFPEIADPSQITSMRIWHCNYKTIRSICKFRNLHTLVIATFPDESLSIIEDLLDLKYLRIIHLPKVTDLSPLESLQQLESLSLATLPSWDSSDKVLKVNSLEPISRLPRLKHLELFGVVSPDKSLVAIENCKALMSARFSKYPTQEIDRFYAVTGLSNAHIPRAEFEG
jgi:hypothetical protein